MAIKLYQFAISHYCEKVRWALDHKQINYQTVTLLPGQHVNVIRQLTGADSSVPVLDHDGHVVQGSARIIDYLDETFPERSLTPDDPSIREQAIAWEKRLDDELGPAVRCYSYHHFLQRPKAVVPLLTAGTPFYNRFLVSLAFSRVNEVMRKWMKINDKTAETSRETMESLLTELTDLYGKQPFLAGNQFSRADLAAAALFAPLFQPDAYPVPWPKDRQIPKDVKAWLERWNPRLQTIAEIYNQHRKAGQ
ncbi:MAG: glutathione S-transferase family protein [Gammaproteobacteria bacterium]|uniref:Glutathione S-transferase n=1 Tax=Marinobacter nitratireducens TaxID=1137280 RepID=A0A072MZD2_9GAMM|nr:glutathione S-transferase family protein [Marinobacter nitratireducens]KEF30794.1 Glutathione S-transferase [Marinobacter nitratireducens]TNE79647.1 MAG: glutathione S-transferase family protein [Gammaproteobacteria bacterium]TNE94106.1 MAG: glutathione S-transferase family protein [Gammaproteobacteria bacterium]